MRRELKEELVKKCQSIPGGSDTFSHHPNSSNHGADKKIFHLPRTVWSAADIVSDYSNPKKDLHLSIMHHTSPFLVLQ
jgi:hypothetical protein